MIKKSLFSLKLSNDRVQCTLCERKCILYPGAKGFCKAMININGDLYTLTYGNISACESRPIEIKPFFHYWPGSTALTFSTWSCNFTCPWCQNYHISRRIPDMYDAYVPPEILINEALKNGDEGLCVSFQEPTLMTDYALDVFRMGQKNKLYACYVSNGYMSINVLDILIESGLTGLKVDIKGGPEVYKRYCGGLNVWNIWRNVKYALNKGIHVEVVNLVITDVNVDDIDWVIENHLKYAGPETPIHFTRYYPAYKFDKPPTPVKVLEDAVKRAKSCGIYYAYIGNVPGHSYENTYCPNCNEKVITRYSFTIVNYNLTKENKCPKCGFKIKMTGKYISKMRNYFI